MKIGKDTIASAIAKFDDDLRKSNKLNERIVFDSQTIGFGLRLRRSGSHTWIFQYRTDTGRQRRETLGFVASIGPDKARKWAIDKYAKLKTGHDPAADKEREREKAKQTLGWAIELFLETKKPTLRANSYAELDRYLHQHWAKLHGTPLAKIDTGEIDHWLKATVKDHGPVSAARGRIALSALFAWAMRKGMVAANPVIASDNPGAGAKTRERVLSDDELRAVWNAADEDVDYHRIIRLLIVTAQRRQEVGSMSWDELDGATWTIPGRRTKNGRQHTITLPKVALEIVKRVPRRHKIPFLFGRDHGFVSWSMAKAEFDKRCDVKGWTVHDLRRTAASGMQRLGIPVAVIEKALNHVSGSFRGVAGVYLRDPMTEDVRKALEAWSAHVHRVVGGKRKKILIPA